MNPYREAPRVDVCKRRALAFPWHKTICYSIAFVVAAPAFALHRENPMEALGDCACLPLLAFAFFVWIIGAQAPAIGALGAGAAGTPTAAAARAHQTVLKLRWKVENPDGDELSYRLAFRQENDAVWRPLGGPDPLTKTEFDWNTEGLPDGNYVVKVTASDERSVPRELALDTTFTSSPILVDNRKPEIVGLAMKYPYVSGRARDDQSPLVAMEYAIDGGEWQILSPADGINDDLVESFTIKLPAQLAPGPHAVTVRVWDSADNVGAASISIRSPGK